MKFIHLTAPLVGLALLLVSIGAQAIKPPPPRTKAQLAGVWIGPDAWGAVLRLELDRTGRGRLVVHDLDSKSGLSVYSVVLTKIKVEDLSFVVSPITKGAANIALYGANDSQAIHLVRYLKDIGDGYGVSALLIRQSDLQSGLQDIGAADTSAHAQQAR